VFGVLLVAASLADVGWEPYRAFFHEMPGLMSGEAFSAFRNPGAIVTNGSVPGIVFKLKFLGVPGLGFETMKIVGGIYSMIVVGAVVWIARRMRADGREPIVWLVVLVLATMRSPFMATYAFFPVMWLVTLVVALRWRAGASAVAAMIAWVLFALSFGSTGLAPQWNAVWTTLQTALAFVLLALLVRQLGSPAATADEPPLPIPAKAANA
jgi:hypothetical protein